jgi:hypothetical protein
MPVIPMKAKPTTTVNVTVKMPDVLARLNQFIACNQHAHHNRHGLPV